jgi:apolipoprotein N-acyltransferase
MSSVTPGAPPGDSALLKRITRAIVTSLARRRSERLGVSLAELAVAMLSAGALALAYLGPGIGGVAFVAPAGLFYAWPRARAGGAAALAASFAGVLSAVGLAWVGQVTVLGLLGLVALFATTFAAGAALGSSLVRRLRVPLTVAAPIVWVSCEYVRSFVLTGFPWLFLGHALSEHTVLIQIADLGGAYLVSFTAALVAAALASVVDAARSGERLSARRVAALIAPALAVLGLQAGYGLWRICGLTTRTGPRLVLIQGNIDTPRGAESDEAHDSVAEEIWAAHAALTSTHASEGDLVVWSESMIPNYYDDPLDRRAQEWRRRVAELLTNVGRELLSGSNAAGGRPDVNGGASGNAGEYNSAFVIDAAGRITARYDKIHLVPFGEYVPLAHWPVLSGLTPYAASDTGYAHGHPDQPLVMWRGYRLGILICYEDAFAPLARRAAGRGADFLVNLSSEAWFAGTAEILQHLGLSRFRAVENRLSLVRCCNVGVTCLIDPAGRMTAMVEGSDRPDGARGAIAVDVPLRGSGASAPPYVAVGDAFAWLCCAAALAGAAWLVALRSRAVGGRPSPGAQA